MLIVGGAFEVEPGRRDDFLRSRESLMRASRSEAGCLEYVFAADPLVDGRVVLFERWESKEALAAHLEANRLRRAQRDPADPEVPALSSEIVQYEVSSVRGLGS